jgi:uncharacterized protein Usg
VLHSDFEKMFVRGYSLVTVNVLYYMPDYQSILNEFLWQTLDISPNYPRIHKFLDFWRKEIDAVIKEVTICDMPDPDIKKWRNGIILPL